jgi:isoleucyl-tRNA synthetase
LAEELYLKLTGGESVHLCDWPKTGHINELSLGHMAMVRELINQGLSQRATAHLKVRQPVQSVKIYGATSLAPELLEIIQEELNVKEVEVVAKSPRVKPEQSFEEVLENAEGTWSFTDLKAEIDTKISPALKREGVMREVIRNVQNARKQAGLNVDDRIKLSLSTTDDALHAAVTEHLDTIVAETLATSLEFDRTYDYETACNVDDAPLTVSLEKAGK